VVEEAVEEIEEVEVGDAVGESRGVRVCPAVTVVVVVGVTVLGLSATIGLGGPLEP
jgi:hypothetical protein